MLDLVKERGKVRTVQNKKVEESLQQENMMFPVTILKFTIREQCMLCLSELIQNLCVARLLGTSVL